MTARFATLDEIAEWDNYLTHNPDGGNVFQAVEIAEIKRQNGWSPRYVMVNDIAITVLEKKVAFLGNVWYMPKGPGVLNVDELIALLPDIRTFASEHHVFSVKIEPEIIESDDTHQLLCAEGLVRTRAIQPNSSTVVVDLVDEETTLASFSQRARRGIRRAEKDGVVVRAIDVTDETMRTMYDLLHVTSVGKFQIRPYEYYASFWQAFCRHDKGQLFLAYYDGTPIAGAFTMHLGSKGVYKDGGSVREKVAQSAGYLLQWEAMRWMMTKGITEYDLHGAPHSSKADDPTDRQHGLAVFKTSFAPIIDYVGCYDLVINPQAYKRWQQFGERVTLSLSYRLKKRQWY